MFVFYPFFYLDLIQTYVHLYRKQKAKQMQYTEKTITPKSVALTKEEFKGLKKMRKRFQSEADFARYIGIPRQLLSRLLLVGSSSYPTIEVVREKLEAA